MIVCVSVCCSGGLLHWADAELGSRGVCAKLEEFARRFNNQAMFAPCSYIKQRAAAGIPLVCHDF